MSKPRISRKKYAIALTHGASTTTASLTNQAINGLLRQVVIKTPAAVDGAATATINIIDSDTGTVYTKASLAANTVTVDQLTADKQVPLGDNYTVQVVFSANQTATDSTTTVALVVDH